MAATPKKKKGPMEVIRGRYKIEGGKLIDIWAQMDDYTAQALELIRQTFRYSESELLQKHEVEFFKILRRAEGFQRDRVKALTAKRK